MTNLSNSEREFIEAVITDESAEIPLDDDEEYLLFTDFEGDDDFYPSVTICHTVPDGEKEAERETIDMLLDDLDWFLYDELTDIEDDRSGDMSHAYFYGEGIDPDVKEQVESRL